ncbi:hypothetical protein J2S31_000710 [Nitrospina gracilis Nb-211]|nr:hypothetical protein [Nitrospina gracilis Nb-211]
MYTRTLNQEELVDWLENYQTDYFCTLTFRFPRNFNSYGREKVSKVIRKFRNILSKKLFGRQPFRLNFIPFIEDQAVSGRPQQIHVHLLISKPDNDSRLPSLGTSFKTLIKETWSDSDKHCSKHITWVKDSFITYKSHCSKSVLKIHNQKGALIYASKLTTKTNTECLDVNNLILITGYC